MTAFQWIAISLLLMAILMTGTAVARARMAPRPGLAWLGLWFAAIVAIAFPMVPVRIANALGIGRGADLVLYFSILFMLLGFFLFYLRYRRLTEELTRIVRHIAMAEAQRREPEALQSGPEALRSEHEALRSEHEALQSEHEALQSEDEALQSEDEAMIGGDRTEP